MPSTRFCCWTALFLVTIIVGCAPAQPEGQAEAIKQLTDVRGERIVFEGIGSGKITARIPWNLGRGEGWNDEQFLASVPHLQKIPQLQTLNFTFTKVTDAGLSGLEKLPQVREVIISMNRLTDAGLEPIQHLVNLEKLTCSGRIPVKEYDGELLYGTGAEHLRSLPKLVSLEMSDLPIDDAGALAISHLPNLKRLNLSGTHLTDAGVASLATMQQLDDLSISSRLITDAALESLGTMTQLKKLFVSGKQLSPNVRGKLTQQLPNTEIHPSSGR